MRTNDTPTRPAEGARHLTRALAGLLLAPSLGGVAPELDDEQRAELRRAGLLDDDGGLDAAVQDAREAATLPLQTVRVQRLGGEARGWLGETTLALLVDREDGWCDLVSCPPDFFADTIARLVELGPRPTPDAADTPGPVRSRWSVGVTPVSELAGPARSLDVVDTATGLWRVVGDPGELPVLQPLSTETLWRELSGLPAA